MTDSRSNNDAALIANLVIVFIAKLCMRAGSIIEYWIRAQETQVMS